MKNEAERKNDGSAKAVAVSPIVTATALFVFSILTVFMATLSALGVKIGSDPAFPMIQLIPLGVYLIGFALSLVWLKILKWNGDPGLFGIITLLSGIGLAVQFRMGSFGSGAKPLQVLLPFPIGMLAFLIGITFTAHQRGKWLERLGWAAYVIAIGLLGAMLVFGRRYRGGIYLPGNINPSEFVKPLLVIFLAAFLSRRKDAFSETQIGIPVPSLRELLLLGALWGVPILLSVLLHDLGFMVLLNAILLIMLFAIAKKSGYLAVGLGAVVALSFVIQKISTNAHTRFAIWISPFEDATGKGWQVLQALSAMYSGGLWGAGLGSGVPHSIPIVTSDFIYAALAEEGGLVGCILLLIAYLVLFSKGLRAAGGAATPFERLLGAGLTASLATQTLLNIAGVTKALPMTGITLPFISHGGSSLITTLLMAGLLIGLSDQAKSK